MFKESNEASIGAVIQNLDGEVMGALLEKQISMPSSMDILESLVTRRAILFVCEMSFNQSFFEGDFEFVINSLRHSAMSSSAFGYLIQDTIFCQLFFCRTFLLSFY